MTGYEGMAELKRAFLACAGYDLRSHGRKQGGCTRALLLGDVGDADVIVMEKDPEGAVAGCLGDVATRLVLVGE